MINQKGLYRALVLVALAWLCVLCIFPVRSNDLFLYLEIGRRFFAPEGLPRTDVFLFTGANAQFDYHHELGSMIFFYVVYALGGFNALIFTKAALFLAMGGLPLWVARKLGGPRFSFALPVFMFFGFYAASDRLIERGSLFSDVFSTLVLSLIIVVRAQAGGGARYRMLIPPIFMAWVNCHAGFVVGFMLLAAWVLAEALQYGVSDASSKTIHKSAMVSAIKTAGAALALGLVNPRGVDAYLLPLRLVGDESLRIYKKYNTEFLSPLAKDFSTYPDMVAYLGVMIACFVLLVVATTRLLARRSYRELPVFEAACFCVLAALGLSMVRFVNTVAFGLAVIVAALLVKGDLLMSDARDGNRWPRLLLPVAALCGMVAFSVAEVGYGAWPSRERRKIGLGVDVSEKPERACAFIDENRVNVNIFNQYEFGAYMIWRWQGRVKVFYHGFVADPDYFTNDYLGVNRSERDFDRIVRTYGIGAFLVKTVYLSESYGPPYYRKLLSSRDWHLVYMDTVAMLFVKDVPENREVIRKFSGRRPTTKGD